MPPPTGVARAFQRSPTGVLTSRPVSGERRSAAIAPAAIGSAARATSVLTGAQGNEVLLIPCMAVGTRDRTQLQYVPGMSIYADLFRYRELFGNLFRRDLRAKYKGSVLGLLWSVANPIALMGVYFLVLAVLWKRQPIVHYGLYLLAGLTAWIFFSVSLQTAARSMIDMAELIKKVRFPRQLVAFSV